jgi:hypothetical protein
MLSSMLQVQANRALHTMDVSRLERVLIISIDDNPSLCVTNEARQRSACRML